ncbi:MAG TPA: AAA family ATPase [Streptosporangiaceae bacterium]
MGSRKSRTLLKLLAVERPGLVPVDRIVEVLWPGEPPAAAEQNVATLVSRLRGVLGSGVVLGGRSGYRLADSPDVGVDLDAAARYCEQAERKLTASPAIALVAAEQAIGLLVGDVALADEPYSSWVDPARDELRGLLRRARLAAAEAALAADDARSAARHAEATIAADPLDEAAYRWYMSACAATSEPAKALVAYAALRERLAAELGADPASPTQELHLAILREQPGERPDRRQARARPDRRATRLAGRDAEIAALREAWSRAVGADAGVVMIIGEAGIGKTALAEDLAAEAAEDRATVLRTRCYEAESSLFLQPVVEALAPVVARMTASALRQLLGEHASAAAALLPEVAALVGPAPSWRGSPEMERRRSFEAMTAFLTGLAERAPVLLVVDDLQYAGQSTVEFIHYLGRHTSRSRLLVAVTVRAEYDQQTGAALGPVATRVEVGPLGAAAVGQLAREAGQGTLTGPILQRTRGHTLFVVEVLRALEGGDPGVPESLRSAVQARVRQTGAAVETLLRAASVLGAAIDPLTLGELLQVAPANAVERCEQALQARLLVVSGRDYEFANDLTREVLYATTPEPTRLAYHRRAADLLTGQPETLARHAAAAQDWPRAVRAWLLAAEDAMRRNAASDGLRAVAAARASADERALAAGLDGLKIAHLNLGDAQAFAAVLAELDPLLRRLGDLFRLQWAEFETAFLFIAAADWDKAEAAMQAAIEINRRGGYPQFAAWYVAHLGWLARLRGRDEEAVRLGRRALTMTDQYEHSWWEAAACAMLGTTLLLNGDRVGAIELLERGLPVAEEVALEAYRLRCAAPLAYATGSPAVLAEADRLLEQASIPADAAWLFGDEACLALARAWLGRGEPERARAVLAPLLAVADRVPWLATLAATLVVDGLALTQLGQDQQARAQLRRAENLAREYGLPHVLREARSSQRALR